MQLNLFGVTEVQTSTCQVPCGDYSIFAAMDKTDETERITAAEAVVYLKINEKSNWDTGQSHGISYSKLAKETGMKRSQVIACVKSLIRLGWLEKKVRDQNMANTYKVIHHQCEPEQVPLDKDGFPLKCATPRGDGSPFALLKDGLINWREFLYWVVMKVYSDWTTGILASTIKQVREWVSFSSTAISKMRKSLARVGLLEKLSKPYEIFVCQLFPKPYKKRRKRRTPKNPKGMRRDKEFYYSFNGLWRVSHKTGDIQAKIEGPGENWRFAGERELFDTNKHIYKDFMNIRNLVTSPAYQRLVGKTA